MRMVVILIRCDPKSLRHLRIIDWHIPADNSSISNVTQFKCKDNSELKSKRFIWTPTDIRDMCPVYNGKLCPDRNGAKRWSANLNWISIQIWGAGLQE